MEASSAMIRPKKRSRISIPSLLIERSLKGIPLSNHAIAWNPSRMRNMRLAVGPTTPAWAFKEWKERLEEAERSHHDPSENNDVNATQDELVSSSLEQQQPANRTEPSPQDDEGNREEDEETDEGVLDVEYDDESGEGEDDDDEDSSVYEQDIDFEDDFAGLDPANFVLRFMQGDDAGDEETNGPTRILPSLRHGGCVNTACWCPTAEGQAPTNIMTSGDDRLVKLWSVHEAMGRAWENGWDSFAPFADNGTIGTHEFSAQDRDRSYADFPGSVKLLKTFRTGHFGNVFHVTPHSDGALTCAADGALRLVSEQHSTLILQSDGLAFSHQPLTEHTGLVCNDSGLNQYDLRCSVHAQPDCLIDGYAIKACAVYQPTLLFVGGTHVELIDIRTVGTIRRYKPSLFSDDPRGISVSGIDVSKDKRSLLVSYESDQIYEFPICPNATSLAGPTIADIDRPDSIVHEHKTFGGHLNRFTFLKNAKYAGPNDEYVVTGSDSGRAWFFRRDTSTVASLLSADTSTCNGVIPHPSLPYFISYGIDSTAKLWRAAPSYKDDSKNGRYRAFVSSAYEMSPVTKSWPYVEQKLQRAIRGPVVYPDFISTAIERAACSQYSIAERFAPSFSSPRIGNALLHLPSLLRRNRYECYRLHHTGGPVPIEQPVTQFSLNTILSRLQYQADRLGATCDPKIPWVLQSNQVHHSDLIPDCPSDWILLDKRMSPSNLLECPECRIPWLSEDQQTPQSGEPFRDKVIKETVSYLKESGNLALSEKLPNLAAKRFDKAIQYCAVVSMSYLENEPTKSQAWSPIVQLLVTIRLNLSLVLLKEQKAKDALEQGQAALGLILSREETDQSKKLRQKAYFRVGSAALACGDYESAVEHLDLAGESDDPVLKRRRIEARQLKRAKQKRARKKYRRALELESS